MKGFFHYTPVSVRFHGLTIPAGTFYGYYGTQIFCSRGAFSPASEGTLLYLCAEGKWSACYKNDDFTRRINRQYEQIISARDKIHQREVQKHIADYPDYRRMSYVPSPKTYRTDY